MFHIHILQCSYEIFCGSVKQPKHSTAKEWHECFVYMQEPQRHKQKRREKISWRGKGKRGEMWEDNENQKKWTDCRSTEEKREGGNEKSKVKTLGILSSHLGKGRSGVGNWIHISGRAMGWYWSTRSPPANSANQHTWSGGDAAFKNKNLVRITFCIIIYIDLLSMKL